MHEVEENDLRRREVQALEKIAEHIEKLTTVTSKVHLQLQQVSAALNRRQ